MKREGFPLETACDRAHKFRKRCHLRIPLDQLGFSMQNRGGMGVSPHHIHEIAWDCLWNYTSVSLYQEVHVVKMPDCKLAEFRDNNSEKCNGSKLMPKMDQATTCKSPIQAQGLGVGHLVATLRYSILNP